MSTREFYDALAPFYDLVYPDWERSMARQAAQLDQVIRDQWDEGARRVLDAACGIGTQVLGLARLGYTVTASDLSEMEVSRAREEAKARGIALEAAVCDMRDLSAWGDRRFDVVIACDNAVPHLLTDDDIRAAFGQFHAHTSPGGGCLITVRDYDKEPGEGVHVKPYGVRVRDGRRYVLLQLWEFDGPTYDVTMYVVEDGGGDTCATRVMRSTYYAVGVAKLMSLLREAGYARVLRLDEGFFQPVIVGTRES